MIKDFEVPEVKDVEIAIVKEGIETGNIEWNVYIINKKSVEIDTVLITSQGYGTLNGQERKSSLLRHFFKAIPANTFEKVEPILEDLFELDNEYWLSFYVENQIYDKKFIFKAGSISDENLIDIPVIDKPCILC